MRLTVVGGESFEFPLLNQIDALSSCECHRNGAFEELAHHQDSASTISDLIDDVLFT